MGGVVGGAVGGVVAVGGTWLGGPTTTVPEPAGGRWLLVVPGGG